MDLSSRLALSAQAAQSKNKRLQEVLKRREEFSAAVDREAEAMPAQEPFSQDCDARRVEGRDISVCVRVRPFLAHEEEAGYFRTALTSNPRVRALDPRMGVRGDARPVRSDFEVDYAFGPEHDNACVYGAVAGPLVELGLKGGVCTLLAYGQTGSGKTHTVGGVLERIAFDLFERRNEEEIK